MERGGLSASGQGLRSLYQSSMFFVFDVDGLIHEWETRVSDSLVCLSCLRWPRSSGPDR